MSTLPAPRRRRSAPTYRPAPAPEALEPRTLLAVHSVGDINTVPATSPEPDELTAVGDTLYFRADDYAHGAELWRTGPAGATLVKDIRPGTTGSAPAGLVDVDGTLYFTADDGTHGVELWRSDGTEAGTVLVADLRPGPAGSQPFGFRKLGGAVYFFANRIGALSGGEYELWRTDGTAAGTTLVHAAGVGGPTGPVVLGNRLAFGTGTSAFGSDPSQLWFSDGTPGGTAPIHSFAPGPAPGNLTVAADGTLYFTADGEGAGVELWKSDGTAAGTSMVYDVRPGATGSAPSSLVAAGGLLYFSADDGTTGAELWASDGTDAGTYAVADIRPGATGSAPSGLVAMDGVLYFAAHDGVNGRELWRSDGTPDGTYMLKNVRVGASGSNPFGLAVAGDVFYFATGGGAPQFNSLWRSDGTEFGTTSVRTFSETLTAPVVVGDDGGAFFVATDAAAGRELWHTDGTRDGTAVYQDISPRTEASNPRFVGAIGETVLFFANDGTRGYELLKTTGAPGDASLLMEIMPGTAGSVADSATTAGALLDGVLYFGADNGVNGRELWRSDGTPAGTYLLKNISQEFGSTPASSDPSSFITFNGAVYFKAFGGPIYKTDGTAAGTVQLKSFASTAGSTQWNVVNGRLVFNATETATGSELWATDGTTAGTVLLRDINPGTGGSRPTTPRAIDGNTVLFFAEDVLNQQKLWRTDGTPAGTTLVTDVIPGNDLNGGVAASGGRLFFASGANATTGTELWASDGTAAGTRLVKDVFPGTNSSFPDSFIDLNGLLLFRAGTSLFRSDGTDAGTFRLGNLDTGGGGVASSTTWRVLGNAVYFVGRTVEHEQASAGRDLVWKTDGSVAGTVVVTNVQPSSNTATPLFPTATSLYFTGNDGARGVELWRLVPDAPQPTLVEARYETPGSGPDRLVFRFDRPVPPTLRDQPLTLFESGRLPRSSAPRLVGGDPNSVVFDASSLRAGSYRAMLRAGSVTDADGDAQPTDYFLDFVVRAAVRDRHVFYNRTAFDAGSADANAVRDADDIAADKRALLPGQTASAASITTAAAGITGVMIDVARLGPTESLSPSSFQLHVGDGTTWTPAPAPTLFGVRRGEGEDLSDRVTLTFANNAIRNTWLRVTMLANAATGLAAPEVFYFGNLAGDTGGPGAPAVNASDLARVRASVGTTNPALRQRYDFNRNGIVDVGDLLTTRASLGRSLRLFTAPAAPAGAVAGDILTNARTALSARRGAWDLAQAL